MENIISGTYFADDAGKIMIVKLNGYIDQTNSYSLQKVFDDIIKSGCFNVIIDFSEVLYISSAGWGIFVGEIKHFRDEGGDIKLANMTPDIYEVYQMLEFYHIFEDFNSVDNAKNSFAEVELENDESPEINEIHEKSLEIDIDEEFEKDEQIENVLEISMGSPKSEDFDTELDMTSKSDELSEEIDITVDENINPDVENVDVNSVHSTNAAEKRNISKDENLIIDLSKLPLHEKIKKLIAEYPLLDIWKIKKLLKDKRFGTVKISIFKLYRTLKQLDLETKIKRYRYYRSS